MKRIYIILLIALLIIAGYFFFTNRSSTITTEFSNFSLEDTASVDRIYIADQDGVTADLTRNGLTWKINGKYKARQDAIDLILRSLKLIKVKEPVPNAAIENIIRQMAGKSIKVEFYTGGDKPAKVFYIGNPTQNHFGTYMLLELDGVKSSRPFVTHIPGFHGYLTARYFTEEDQWRDRAVFAQKANDISSIQIKYHQKPLKSFKLERNGEHFKVTNLSTMKVLDEIQEAGIDEYLSRFKGIYYEYIQREAPMAKIDSVTATEPIHSIELTTTSGDKIEVLTYFKPVKQSTTVDPATGEFYTKDLDRLYAWKNKEDFVVMQWPTLDRILAYYDDFRSPENVDN